jgi:hypothetical protein
VDTYSRSLFSYERRTNTFIAFASDLGLQPGQWPEAFELKDDTGSLTFNKVRDEVEGRRAQGGTLRHAARQSCHPIQRLGYKQAWPSDCKT